MKTRILKVPLAGRDESALGRWATGPDGKLDLNHWIVPSPSTSSPTAENNHNNSDITNKSNGNRNNGSRNDEDVLAPLREAAHILRTTSSPVAFPTETVYGLGADATRSDAVRGIYAAKGRPSDNPLIVHVSDLTMLRRLLVPGWQPPEPQPHSQAHPHPAQPESPAPETTSLFFPNDPIPAIYHPLISRFWPGPLTILLPLPSPSPLAPEVTASQPTFGARMPASALARTLISLTGAPLAAPSANASTRPSPTAARHVAEDLDGRGVALVLDGGVCAVGVESTVVDGLSSPPAVLRPGGVGLEELRRCEGGWEGVVKGYKDEAMEGGKPRAPGMKYKHYSPRARVVLFEKKVGAGGGRRGLGEGDLVRGAAVVGVVRTGGWTVAGGLGLEEEGMKEVEKGNEEEEMGFVVKEGKLMKGEGRVLDVDLGEDVGRVAHALFGVLRELDRLGADVIYVEGVGDGDDIGAAVMNRLRKAASEIRV
ncbi:hypothetical protein VTJ04DRAFT_3617 [Mycothermus thermophilus]|uniref:uncharacterized protein n=1 Tax=Humicola insolens TaxID=85995 RepID=UPI0037429CDD